MRANGGMFNDDSGSNVLVEYIFIIIITTIFFTMFIFLLSSMIRNTDQTIVGQELGVVANDIANRISGTSDRVNFSQYSGGSLISDFSSYSEAIDLPQMAQGKQYTVAITYDNTSRTGLVTVTYGDNVDIGREVAFRSGNRVVNSTISSTDASPKICYDPAQHTITVVAQ